MDFSKYFDIDKLKEYFSVNNLKKAGYVLLRLCVSALFIGVLVAIIKYCAYFLITYLYNVFIDHDLVKSIIFFIALPFVVALMFYINNFKKKTNSKYEDIVYSFFTCLASICSFSTFCYVEPTLNISILIHKQVNEYFTVSKDEENEELPLVKSAALSCVLNSPLTGLCDYIESDEKKNVRSILKIIPLILIGGLAGYLLFKSRIFTFDIAKSINVYDYYISIPVIILIIAFNYLVSMFYKKTKDKIINLKNKYANSIYAKFSLIIFFVVSIILALLLPKYMSFDLRLINNINIDKAFYLIILIIIFRICIMLFSSSISFEGGKFIAELVVGAIIGMLVINLIHMVTPTLEIIKNGYPNATSVINIFEYQEEIILLSMISFYSITNKRLLTSITLIFAFTSWSSCKSIIVMAGIVCILSYVLTYFTHKFESENN